MLNKKLTCYTYLKVCGNHKVAARLDTTDPQKVNAIITETSETCKGMLGEDIKLHDDQHYLVGEIADRLYAYESLGYSPEELKKIVEEHNHLNMVSKTVEKAVSDWRNKGIYITTARQNGKSLLDAKRLLEEMDYIRNDIDTTARLAFRYNPAGVIGHVHKAEAKHDGLSAKVTLFDEMHMVKADEYARCKNPSLAIEKVIFNDPATIVFWKDGTKTVVKATNEEFDPEKGLAMAISKKALGNKHDYYNVFKKWKKKYKKSEED